MKFHDVSNAMTKIVQQMLEHLGEYGAIEDLSTLVILIMKQQNGL